MAYEVLGPSATTATMEMMMASDDITVQILREMTIRPRVLLVETHGLHDAPSPRVRTLMEAAGYTVSDLGWAEPREPEACACHDIRVLQGLRGV